MKGLYKMDIDCGRQGDLMGIFVAEVEAVKELISSGREIYFGEVLGKHSEIFGAIEEEDLTLITTEANVINIVEEYSLSSGYSPFDYDDYDENDDEDE